MEGDEGDDKKCGLQIKLFREAHQGRSPFAGAHLAILTKFLAFKVRLMPDGDGHREFIFLFSIYFMKNS